MTKDKYLKAAEIDFDIYELLKGMDQRILELQNTTLQINAKTEPQIKFMRPNMIEQVYGIKRSSLESYSKSGILTKQKLFGCLVYSVEEIESKIKAV